MKQNALKICGTYMAREKNKYGHWLAGFNKEWIQQKFQLLEIKLALYNTVLKKVI